MADNQVSLEILLQVQKSLQDLKTFQEEATQSTKAVADGFQGLKRIGEAALAFLAVDKITSFFAESVRASAEQQDAINDLNQSLASSGQYSAEATKDFQNFASSLQLTTKYSDETTEKAAGLIESLGHLSEKGLKGATQAAEDMASALHMDLNTAALLVGKAAAGDVATFTRYGLSIQKGATAAETFANALKAINDKFGGRAAAEVNTYSGAVAQLSNMWNEVEEAIGNAITQNPAVIAVIKSLTTVFAELSNDLGNNREQLSSWVTKGIDLIAESTPTATTAVEALVFGLEGLAEGGGHAVADFIDIFAAVGETVYAVVGPAVDIIGRLEATIIDLAAAIPGVSGVANDMGVDLKGLSAAVDQNRQDFEDMAESADKSVRGMAKSVRDDTDSMVSGFDSFNTGLQHVKDTVDDASGHVLAAHAAQKESFKNQSQAAQGATKDLKAYADELKSLAEFEKKLDQDATNSLSPADKAAKEWKDALDKVDQYAKDGLISWQRAEEDKAKATSTYTDKITKINADAADKAEKDAEQRAQALAQFLDGLNEAGASQLEKTDLDRQKDLDKVEAFEQAKTISHQQAIDAQLQIDRNYVAQRNQILSQDPTQLIPDIANGKGVSSTDALAAGIGGLTDAVQGAAGAAKLVSSAAGAIADLALPGVGSAVTSLVGILAQGPDATKAQVKAFVEAVPQIMQAIAESIPVLVDTLVDELVFKGGALKIGLAIDEGMINGLQGQFEFYGDKLGLHFGDSLNSPNFSRTVHGWFSGVEQNFGKLSAANFAKGIQGAGKELERVPGLISTEVFQKMPGQIRAGFDAALVDLRREVLAIPGELRGFFTGEVPKAFGGAFTGVRDFFEKDLPGDIRNAALSLGNGIEQGVVNGAKFIGEEIYSVFSPIERALASFETTPPWLADFEKAVHDLTGFGGIGGGSGGKGGGGALSTIGKAVLAPVTGGASFVLPGNATGLTEVPSGYPNDNYVTGLTSGERVVDAGTNQDLKSFLARQGNTEALLAQILTALREPQLAPLEVKIGADTLAKTMLRLNRSNARVSA